MFALADINSFYASCEKVFRPDLRNEPVIVLSNNDGCVIARSPEAKALGIRMGQPAKWHLNRSQFGIRIDHDLASISDHSLASQSITIWHASDH